jgi:hypothetical protein
MKAFHISAIVGMIAVAACSKSNGDAAANRSGHVAEDSAGTGMEGMPGMAGSGMMATMPAHLESMMRMKPEQMSQTMPQHERMMSQMMDQMGGEMRQMNMTSSPEWTALSDSVKADLADLPGLSGQQLSARMKAHADRARRLIAMHQGMMK